MTTPQLETATKSARTELDVRMERILTKAREAAFAAAKAHDATLGDERSRGFDRGFAWVVIKPARGPFIAWLRKQREADAYKNHAELNGRCSSEADSKFGSLREYGGGGWQFWCTGFHRTQSIGTHRAAAEAFAKVLVENDIPAEVGSRLD